MIFFGCSQWGYSNWKGTIYPSNARAGDFLYHYAKKFNAVELNPTYHDYVSKETLGVWKEQVGTNFRFCPKFPKTISHDNWMTDVKSLTDDFIDRVSVFGENLGISFLQLSPYFMPAHMNALDEFLKLIPQEFKISVELREPYLSNDVKLPEALQILRANKAGVVIADDLERRKYVNRIKLTNHSAFVRFIAYGHETDFPRIDDWVKLLKLWESKGLPEIYFFLHFPAEGTSLDILYYTMKQFEGLMD